MKPATQTCIECGGKGTVPHTKRVMENGHPDPADFRVVDLCSKCNGSGQASFDPKTVPKDPTVTAFGATFHLCPKIYEVLFAPNPARRPG